MTMRLVPSERMTGFNTPSGSTRLLMMPIWSCSTSASVSSVCSTPSARACSKSKL